jgi:hypothetical protein
LYGKTSHLLSLQRNFANGTSALSALSEPEIGADAKKHMRAELVTDSNES